MKSYTIIRLNKALISLMLLVPAFFSCSPTRHLTYFQNKTVSDTVRRFELATMTPVAQVIEQDDILAIVVNSLSEESNTAINSINNIVLSVSSFPGAFSTGTQPLGYMVDQAGEVNLPLAGKIKLSGLTLEEAGKALENKLSTFLTDPSVNVRLLNSKFTIIGEVTRPGVYNLTSSKMTLPDVIGIAGDLTVFGRRDNVSILRTTDNKRELVKIDLTSMKVLESPYYFIRKNDVVYVETKPGKVTSTSRGVQLLPIFLSIASTILIVVNFIKW